MRFCIRCGREFDERFIVKDYGLCIDCFIESKGIFRERPVVNLTQCPKCGSLLVENKWVNLFELDVVKKYVEKDLKKSLNHNVALIDVEMNEESIYVSETPVVLLKVSINGYERAVHHRLNVYVSKKLCPRCFSQSAGNFRVLIQFRADGRRIEPHEIDIIKKTLSEPNVAGDIVEVKEDRDGLDVKLSSLNTARRIVKKLSKAMSIKVIETFKSRKYDAQRGVWLGENVISVRLPRVKPNIIVEYRGRLGLVKEVKPSEILVEDLSDGTTFKVSSESYWKGDVKVLDDLRNYGELRIIGYDSSTMYLLNDKSGEIVECPLIPNLKFNVNEIVHLIEVDGKRFIVKKQG